MSIPNQEDHENPSNPTAPLLSFTPPQSSSTSSSSSSCTPKRTITVLSLIAIAVTSSVVLFFFLSSSPTPPPPTKLSHPTVILISSDGFRFGYQFKTKTPNIDRLIKSGTEAERGLIPVFPTITFPNHYSIATGLYPAYHGIIQNYFIDPSTGESFTTKNTEPKWWLGEPLWETVTKHGFNASSFFWPGAEVNRGSWTCPSKFCPIYNKSLPVSFDQRVDTVLQYFDLPIHEIPVFTALYFEDPDAQGHKFGPDHPEITKAVARVDSTIGRLIRGLEERGMFEEVNIILVGDHGMSGLCDTRLISLEDLSPWIEIPPSWIQSRSYSPLLLIRPPEGESPSDIVAKMNEGLKTIENGAYLKVYLKEELPDQLHYKDSDRIPPIVGLVDEGFKVVQKRTEKKECGGAHGYDNAFFSMRSIFIGHGPRFRRGVKIPSFENIQIYNLITSILKIKQGAPNNGTMSFPNSVLLPGH